MLYEIPHYQSSHSNAVHSELDTVCVEVHTLPHIPRVEGGRRVCMFIENRDNVWFEV